jgi:hypothetical protein
MEAVIAAAAQALAAGDPLGALNGVALRDNPPALALRGIAMAQIGDLSRARALLKRAARGFGPSEVVARARCIVADAEIALVSRELGRQVSTLAAARATLEAHGDHANALHARHLELRWLILAGRLDAAEAMLAELGPVPAQPRFRAAHELVVADIAIRRLRAKAAREAIARAGQAARTSRIAPLIAEIEGVSLALDQPAARLVAGGAERLLLLDEVETLLESEALVIDACRSVVRHRGAVISLARRPVLFHLARGLGEVWPADAPREVLVARAFRGKRADPSHRARLRVEIGRLRKLLKGLTEVRATNRGFVLAPPSGKVLVLAPPVEDDNAALLALLADGEAWSSSALAFALGASPRTVQRALDGFAAQGKAQAVGRGRGRRWVAAPVPGFTTVLLLPGALPGE